LVSKVPPALSPDSSVVGGQPGFAKQFQDFQELARLAAVSSPTARASRRSTRPAASTTQTVGIPEHAAPNRTASGVTQGDRPTGGLESGVGQNASTATDPTDPNAPNVPHARVSNAPLVGWLEQTAFPNQVQNLPDSAAPAESGAHSHAAALAAVPLQPRPTQPAPVSGESSAVIKNGSEAPASAAVSSQGAHMTARTSRRSARPAASTTQTVAIPEQAKATAAVAASANVPPVSAATRENRPTRAVNLPDSAAPAESEANSDAAALAAVPLQPRPPFANVPPDPGKVGPSVSPSRTTLSGAAQADRPTGSIGSGAAQNASAANAPHAPISNVPLVGWLEQTAPQPSPVSAKSPAVAKNGSESPASAAPDSSAAAPEVAGQQAQPQAAAAVAPVPFVQAALLDTGIAPQAAQSSTPEKAGQPVSGPNPRAVNAESGTPGKAEAASADLAFAVRVKAPASPAASVPSAPAKELRRVDLADAPPAAAPRTETSRAGAWALSEGPARAASQPAAETPSRLPERLEATPIPAEEAAPKAAAPLKDLLVQVGQSSQESVELRVVEREGELHVAVRTGDADLAHGLRQGLPELVDHLDQGGFRAEAWRPSGVVSAPEPSSQTQSRSSESRNADSQSQPGWSQQERGQRDHNQSNRPKWVEELEGNLAGGGERSTGEFHGFTH
jgi:nicotinate-nucleotide--dimethylbenzimidazole phosphoribosyltransferase